MAKRHIEEMLSLVDQVRRDCGKYGDILLAILEEGGKRPKLKAEERENLEEWLGEAKDRLQQAIEQMENA